MLGWKQGCSAKTGPHRALGYLRLVASIGVPELARETGDRRSLGRGNSTSKFPPLNSWRAIQYSCSNVVIFCNVWSPPPITLHDASSHAHHRNHLHVDALQNHHPTFDPFSSPKNTDSSIRTGPAVLISTYGACSPNLGSGTENVSMMVPSGRVSVLKSSTPLKNRLLPLSQRDCAELQGFFARIQNCFPPTTTSKGSYPSMHYCRFNRSTTLTCQCK